MFGLGFSEILVLGAIALIFLGPEQLPELARTLGRFINDLKRSTESITEDLKAHVESDLREKRNELSKSKTESDQEKQSDASTEVRK
jgi:sec-independent protein translocase protein TatB